MRLNYHVYCLWQSAINGNGSHLSVNFLFTSHLYNLNTPCPFIMAFIEGLSYIPVSFMPAFASLNGQHID